MIRSIVDEMKFIPRLLKSQSTSIICCICMPAVRCIGTGDNIFITCSAYRPVLRPPISISRILPCVFYLVARSPHGSDNWTSRHGRLRSLIGLVIAVFVSDAFSQSIVRRIWFQSRDYVCSDQAFWYLQFGCFCGFLYRFCVLIGYFFMCSATSPPYRIETVVTRLK